MRKLNQSQANRIITLIHDEWVVDCDEQSEKNFTKLFNEIEIPIELHLYAKYFNWDCGWDEMVSVIEHPMCDFGTALLIFWYAQPDFYYQKADKGTILSTEEEKSWTRIKWLEEKLLNRDFVQKEIFFSPSQHVGRDVSEKGLGSIPVELCQDSPGAIIEIEIKELINQSANISG